MTDMTRMPPDAIEITDGERDFYVPQFEVFMSGRSMPKDIIRDVTQVTYKDSIKELDSFEITINNWDADTRTYKYSDHGGAYNFDPGQKLVVKMGYFGRQALTQMIEGEITQLRPAFPASGAPTLQISGLNILHRLRKKQNTESYTKTNELKIASTIAKRLTLDFKGKESEAATLELPYVLQDNQFDIIFLMERARRISYDIFVEEDPPRKSILHFEPSDSVQRRRYDLKYGKSLIQFTPTLTTKDQVNKVTVKGWDAVH
ncbi:MAG: phage late control D family protein, partial [Anaerolineae bacterium]|nr:phage late control D family protein [Anaerolineae bacterium]